MEQPFYLEATGIIMAERKGGALGRLPQYLSTCPPYCPSPAREMYVARMLKVYPIEHVCLEDAGGFHFLPLSVIDHRHSVGYVGPRWSGRGNAFRLQALGFLSSFILLPEVVCLKYLLSVAPSLHSMLLCRERVSAE